VGGYSLICFRGVSSNRLMVIADLSPRSIRWGGQERVEAKGSRNVRVVDLEGSEAIVERLEGI
jgi:hypothetical protein